MTDGASRRAATVVLATALLPVLASLWTTDDPGHALTVAAAVACLVVGTLAMALAGSAWAVRGACLIATGLLVAVVAAGSVSGASLAMRDLAIGAAPCALATAAAAVLEGRWPRVAALAGGVLAGPARSLVHDPFTDPRCAGCAHGVLAVWPDPALATGLKTLGAVIVAAALVVALVTRREPPEIVVLAGCVATFAAWPGAGDAALVVGALTASTCVGRHALPAARRSRRVNRLARALGDGATLAQMLREDLGDSRLRVVFPTPGVGLIDTAGRRADAIEGLTSTELTEGGSVVAVVQHSPGVALPDLADALDGAARMRVVNEQLTAQLAARVVELDRSRGLVVQLATADRRNAERDVHDGVQQQLLALGLELRLAADRHPGAASSLEAATAEVGRALDEVREISHGVYPPLLSSRGLGPAVEGLVRRHGGGTEIRALPSGRLDDSVERAAYAVLAEAVDRDAQSVAATVEDDELRLRAEGARPGLDGILPDLVAALGGRTELSGPVMTAVIPCGP
jgi:signal transduction histidine kinase